MSWRDEYMRRYYTSRSGWRDGTAEYYAMLARHVRPDAEVLEVGCGPSNEVSRELAGRFGAVDGLDIGEAARTNDAMRNVWVYDGNAWPIKSEQYDAVVANFVLEHVERPNDFAAEAFRVLRPGGVMCFRTPNRWHYVAVVSQLTPHWFHERVANRLRALEDEADDPYPTFYRMNTCRCVGGLFRRAGFSPIELRTIEKEPSYGMAHPGLFLGFMLYERIVNSAAELGWLRSTILGAFGKGSHT